MANKPTAAFVLSLIGGIFVLLGGVFQAFIGAVISGIGTTANGTSTAGVGSVVGILGIIGIIFGIVMILGGVMMYSNPESHKMWGVIVLILSIISFATSSVGGFVIGFLLGLIGGILGLVFKPSMGPAAMQGQSMGSMPMGSTGVMGAGVPVGQMGMTCKNCGASIPAGATRCPSCGASV